MGAWRVDGIVYAHSERYPPVDRSTFAASRTLSPHPAPWAGRLHPQRCGRQKVDVSADRAREDRRSLLPSAEKSSPERDSDAESLVGHQLLAELFPCVGFSTRDNLG